MKKIIVLFIFILLLCLRGIAQVAIHYLLPMGVFGDPYSDTLHNTRSIMLKEGIKKTVSWQDFPEITKTFASKTVYYNNSGAINAVRQYLRQTDRNDSTRYIADSLLYDAGGRLVETKIFDATKKLVMHLLVTYSDPERVKYLWASTLNTDTTITYEYRNTKRQLIMLAQANREKITSKSFIFYNTDGLVDSIREENASVNTLVFNRVHRKKSLLLTAENDNAKFEWTYNLSGQCISTSIAAKNRFYLLNRGSPRYRSQSFCDYYYNLDGTLSKVTCQGNDGRKVNMYYSYFK